MGELFKVADLFVEKVKQDYATDVAIIGYYGSYAEGTQNAKSDIDIFFIPNTNRGRELGECFIIEDIGIDLFPISWGRAENIAEFNEVIVSVLADCKILYSASEEDLNRFEALRDKIKSFSHPEKRSTMVDKAQGIFNKSFVSLYNLEELKVTKDYTAVRVEAFKIITSVLESLALLNQTYLKKGWGKNLDQAMAFEIKPNNLKDLIEAIIIEENCCETIVDYCKMLVDNTKDLLIKEQKALSTNQADFSIFEGYYEEMKSYFNKIIAACDDNDYRTAFFATVNLQSEITTFLKEAQGDNENVLGQYDLPNLIEGCQKGKLEDLKEAVMEFEDRFVSVLMENGIAIKAFSNIEEYEACSTVGVLA